MVAIVQLQIPELPMAPGVAIVRHQFVQAVFDIVVNVQRACSKGLLELY
jgi:hypothetical protein